MKLQKISCDNKVLLDIDKVKQEPGLFTMSFGFDPAPLAESIKKIGLINLPLVIKDTERDFDVVSGYRRLMALKYLNEKQLTCIDLSSSGLSLEDLFLLNFYENLTIRPFNLIEKGMIIHRLTSYISREDIIKYYLPALQISNINDLDIFLKIEQLNEQCKMLIAEGLLSFKTVRLIIDIDEQSREAIINLIVSLKLNFNYQYQFIDYLKDISVAENKLIYDILKEERYQNILDDKRANNPQKSKLLFALIRDRKFPLLTSSEKTFRKRVSSFNLPEKTRIVHPPFFEAPGFRLEIFFNNGKELLEKIRHLSNLESLKSITSPWKGDDSG
ncbi:ParB/RepB/Spo0J family partition protein [Thermodesulfobacteriota bacterium]